MWHESNVNADDIMMIWFTLFASLVMSCLACAMCTCMHGAFAPNKYGASKYLSSLACMQADLNLEKITASHSQVISTQNANKNMPNMIPIAYLNENLMDCNENFAWGKSEALIHSYMFLYTTKGESGENLILHSFHVDIITYKSFQTNIPQLLSTGSPSRACKQPVWIST